ncbi:MAG: YHS domain-containing protein [Methanomicrobiales archaeon]|nr:YHS domain-containing protein [Methanomicrobiales archaeon]
MATDPVCYGEVDEETASQVVEYKGQKYYFCTASCRKKFEENPGKYTKLGPAFKIDPGMSC